MKEIIFLLICLLAIVSSEFVVTCGSIIKLKHQATNARLHSHQIPYGTGSGQQSVTGFPGNTDSNSYWLVTSAHNEKPECKPGQTLKNGDIFSLKHVNTGKKLHSHLHRAPLSGQQEVSCFTGDTGDNWKLETANGGIWKKGETVRLIHVDTNKFLHSHNFKYGHPIPNQQEITCFHEKNRDNDWEASEGIYYPESK